MKELIKLYENKRENIRKKLDNFKNLEEEAYLNELIFCILTPQSNAQKCWNAVLEIKNLKEINKKNLLRILKTKTRFHNNKSRYILENLKNWDNIKKELLHSDIKELRNWLADYVIGYGLKEAGHFLRNIGKSDNKIAILDRHILKNLKEYGIIKDEKIRSKKNYYEIEKKFIGFSERIGIPLDELDLLFWSKENGEIFK